MIYVLMILIGIVIGIIITPKRKSFDDEYRIIIKQYLEDNSKESTKKSKKKRNPVKI